MHTVVDLVTLLVQKFQKKPTVTSQTLTAGSTSVTFTGLPTTGDYLIDFWSSTGVNYTAIDVSTPGTAVLTYEEQASNITVFCKVEEV